MMGVRVGPEVPLRIAGRADLATVTALIGDFRDFLEGDSPSNAQIESVVGELIADPGTEYLLIGDPERGFAQVRANSTQAGPDTRDDADPYTFLLEYYGTYWDE